MTPYPPPPQPQPAPPEPPQKNYFKRNLPGSIGFLCIIASGLLITILSGTFLTNLWPITFLAGVVLCCIGLFRSPRLLPALGCLGSAVLALVMVIVLFAVGQWKAPERTEEDEIAVDTAIVANDSTTTDSNLLLSPDSLMTK